MIDFVRRGMAAFVALGLLAAGAPAPAAVKPDVARATLANGLRVVVVRDPLAPVVTEEVNYLVGSQDTPRGFPGMAHAEEHMVASRSTKDLSANQIATITTLLGGDFDADTQTSVTQYYITTPAADLDVALRVEASRMRGALNRQAEWAQERGAIEQEVSRDLSNAFYRYYEKATGIMFAGTPYDHTALGTRASFAKTTGAALQAFYRTWYAPNNAILVIAGDVDPQATVARAKAIFGDIPRRAVPSHAPVALLAPKVDTIRDESDFPVPLVLLTYRLPGYAAADFAAGEIAMDVLQSERGSLGALAYEGKALATGVQFQPNPASSLAFAYVATAPGADTTAALGLLDGVVAGYQKDGVPADLVEAAKRREIAQALYARNSIDGLATAWSEAVAVEGRSSPDDDIARIASVSVDDVNRVVRTYLKRDRAVVGVLTPKPGSVPSSGGEIGVKDTFSPKDEKPATVPAFAKHLLVASVPASSVHPVDSTLPNGLRLIVQPESVSPTVTVRGVVRSNPDLQTPDGKEGVATLLGGLFPYGTASLDRLAFQKELDAIAADESAGTDFSLDVPSKDFERGVQLLADNELHPALPQPAFAIVQQQTASALTGQRQSPDYLARRALLGALVPKDDPALREPTPATVGALKLDDVKAYHAAVFRPDETTIVVAGDVTPERAVQVVTKFFGEWSAAGPKPATDLPPVPKNAAAVQNVSSSKRTQASVTLSEQLGGLVRTDPDYDALTLGNAILGGGFYSTRFSRDLRKENGLVYSIDVQLQAGKTRATYDVDFGSDPQNAGKARAIIDRDLHDIATVAPSEAEMQQAKTQLLRELSLSEASVDGIAAGLARRSLNDLPLDEPTREAHAIDALSASAVREAFAKWIDPARFVQVTVGP